MAIQSVKLGVQNLTNARSIILGGKIVKQIKLGDDIIWPLSTESIWLEDDKGNKITEGNPFKYYYTSNTTRSVYLRYDASVYSDIGGISLSSYEGIEDWYETTIVFQANYEYDGYKTYTVCPLDYSGNYIYDENGNQVALTLYCLFNLTETEGDDNSNYSYEELVVTPSYYSSDKVRFDLSWKVSNLNTGEQFYETCYNATYGEIQADGEYTITDDLNNSGTLFIENRVDILSCSYVTVHFSAEVPNNTGNYLHTMETYYF